MNTVDPLEEIMNSRQLCLMLIRLVALLGVVLALQYVPSTLTAHSGGSVLDLAVVFCLSVLTALILPAILWFLAPLLSRYMVPADDATMVTAISGLVAFRLGVALLGLWLIPHAIFQLLGVGWTILGSSLPGSGGTAVGLSLNHHLYETVVVGVARLIIGAFLFLRAASVAALASKLGVFDKEV